MRGENYLEINFWSNEHIDTNDNVQSKSGYWNDIYNSEPLGFVCQMKNNWMNIVDTLFWQTIKFNKQIHMKRNIFISSSTTIKTKLSEMMRFADIWPLFYQSVTKCTFSALQVRLKKIAVIFIVITPYLLHTTLMVTIFHQRGINTTFLINCRIDSQQPVTIITSNIEKKVLNQIWKLQVIKVNSTSWLKNIFIVNCCSSVFGFLLYI